ncbi:hypothetical protein HYDPIDRAFT_32390 [Hydnomerulius pinastri MD-312]|uniref:Uncharacterized protein n=1 Tax=Hydnomerulius pinastri MD-312 TaxID=994086 RepID=A0A0C9WAP4_9AGAM|nr:hypothetical protein HYDPIDRAFT_32390 [Hydnomerulius pinastri MD-312]
MALLENPNNAIRPNFTTEEHAVDCQQLVDSGIPPKQTAAILANLWSQNNERDKARWAQRMQEQALAEAEAAQREEEEALRQRKAEEADCLFCEECNKNKTKYAPNLLPLQVAIHKLKANQPCELWYFTNDGLADTEKSGTCSLDDSSITIMQSADGQPTFVPSIIAKDKVVVIQDEDLTWEQFGEAALRMLDAMHNYEWQEYCIKMHLEFWGAIENHPWHHLCSEYQK